MRRIVLVAAAALIAGGVAAGVLIVVSDDDAKALSKPEYVSRVNAVCKVYNAMLAKIPAPVAVGNPKAVAAAIEQALPLVVERAAKVRAVAPPAEIAAEVRRMLSFSDRAIAQLRLALREARAGKILEPSRALGRFAAFGETAHAIGVKIGLSC